MSLRCIFIVCLNDNNILFYNSFRTVENRWIARHPKYSNLTLPKDEELVQSLLNELGILNSATFQDSRDSCKKNFHAPLFWVPYSQCQSYFWPVLIVECKNRLLCGIPFLENINPLEEIPYLAAGRCADISTILELLVSLVCYAELPYPKLGKELTARIHQHLPFGRPIHQSHAPEVIQAPTVRTSWLRSKPRLDLKIVEEVRSTITSRETKVCELYGTAIFSCSERDIHVSGVKLQLHFQRLKEIPEIVYHSCVSPESGKDMVKMTIKYLPDKTFTLLHYNYKLKAPPVDAVLKIRNIDDTKRLVAIQLRLNTDMKFVGLNRLEVRMPMPEGNKVNRIASSVDHNPIGTLSLLKGGTMLSWSIISQTSSNSSSSAITKIKEDPTLNAEIEMEKPNISLRNAFVTIIFSATGSTLTDIKLNLHQSGDFKLSQGSAFKSGFHYRSWNDEAEEVT